MTDQSDRKMGRRIGRAALVAVVVLMVAVTPLSAIFRPAYFEVGLRGVAWGLYLEPRVVLDDRTGLVAAMRIPLPDETASSTGTTRFVRLSWPGGCDEQLIWLTFDAVGAGYRVEKRTTSNGCQYLVLLPRDVVLILRAPIDASTVQLVDVS